MKKFLLACLISMFVSVAVVPTLATTPEMDAGKVNQGIVQVKVVNPNSKKMKIMIEKDATRYSYVLQAKAVENFPLQMGNGSYTVYILENIEGDQYRVLSSDTVNLSVSNDNIIYLNSVQLIDWDTTMRAIAKAKELTAGLTTEQEKFDAIYNYMITNFAYDFAKLSTVTSDYLPVIDRIYDAKKGICYDYAAVLGAMLRSVQIPSRLIMGYTEYVPEYHAWNEVYLQSQGRWVVVDTTVDASYAAIDQPLGAYKEDAKYKKVKQY